MRLFLLGVLILYLLCPSCKQIGIQPSSNYTVIRDSMDFLSPGLDSVTISIDIELPTDSSSESQNIREYIISRLLYPFHDSISNLPLTTLKDSIMKRLYMRRHCYAVSVSDGSKYIHDYTNVSMIESGVPNIKTFLYKDKKVIYDRGIFFDSDELVGYTSINTSGKGICLLDLIKENTETQVLSLLREEIKEYCKKNGKSYCDDNYSDLFLITSVSVINKRIHCEMMRGVPDDFEIDIPLTKLQEYLSVGIRTQMAAL